MPSLPASRFAAASAMIAWALGSLGCAFTDVHVHPPSPAEIGAQPPVGRGREVILVMPFADGRMDRIRCGNQRNGYGSDTADVICSVDPPLWVAHALAQGLIQAGFRVLMHHPSPGPQAVWIDGIVAQFYLEPDLGIVTVSPEADISVRLLVRSGSGLIAERTFYFKAIETSFMSSEGNFQLAADNATRQAVSGMVLAIASLLDRFPQLGAPSTP